MLETALEEFTIHPFSMPALLSTMAGRLDEAKEYVNILGETPRHWQAKDFSYNDFCRVSTELVVPYTTRTISVFCESCSF